jgi:hypothetical protein
VQGIWPSWHSDFLGGWQGEASPDHT